jgi:haloacetate dehalogenase
MSIETNRRDALVAVAASGLLTSVSTTPAAAQGAGVVATASEADYKRDPARWGSADVAAHFPGFKHLDMRTSGAIIRLRHGGFGPPLLLVHGNPLNHTSWYKVAAKLAEQYHVVLPDLRGYGDSSLPESGPNNINFSFREMGRDLVEVMDQLGYQRFMIAGHDRGGRTAYRLCLDQPERVMRVCIMDVVPNYHVWTNITKNWVISTWHWGFMAQPEPFPERLISAVPAEYFLKSRMAIRGGTGLDFLTDTAMNEYVRCYTLKTITGSCRDYRATATCDFEMDTADKDKKIDMPLLLLWGARGQPPERAKEFLDVWKRYATNIVAYEAIECGHYIQEEVPDKVIQHFMSFFKA